MIAKPRAARYGFAAMTAITLLALVGVVVASLAMSLRRDAFRTSAMDDQAQLRQLLLVAAGTTVTKLNAGESETLRDMKLDLPAALKEREASASVVLKLSTDGSSATADITAGLGDRRLHESLELRRTPTGWAIADAMID